MNIKRFFLDRLDERSTWRGLIALLTVSGISLSPEQTNAIIAAGVAIGALVEALLPDPAGRIRDNPQRVPEQSDVPSATSNQADPDGYDTHDRAFGPWHSD
jgi:hypothetical protein